MNTNMSQIIQLAKFFEGIKDSQVPIKTAYKLHQLKKEVDSNLAFYQKNVQRITERYAESTAQEEILIAKENQSAFYKEIEELLNLSIELSEINFEISEFDNLRLPFEVLEPIFNFIK